ncbi:RNB family domain containing protein [Entamoeba histolytica HM-1:IMSS-B]|uniref:RNB family domain containing protein n=6 Tax=Entamoeba histolytica TaxID=5759 RepID=C4LX93_ENTH1|nr:hypothetical protein EHI_013270 [Entamoeba histolytica HM-1:IMSS]EMD47153.1 RNB family protein [Entamoeba histolytica KU27]EMH76420.1 RNB family domain containing protein [Entamoeba histolytica HM-1:IMSS-B]EMS11219.1 RNB family domain containing protein [Entamoeba histolytica HM-3:IMSS]ENY64239.1 RNB family domain containing protein [Entamoeba histolytica HM-1:IMSS-A]GAT93364.1 hypothetical protein CL6EHI_013270 [Entamoeba histolytica]|eukprot:XP_656302.1 hypothetical protein EHI_013270 [Entamoeba histolytica HM-1:IMSS]
MTSSYCSLLLSFYEQLRKEKRIDEIFEELRNDPITRLDQTSFIKPFKETYFGSANEIVNLTNREVFTIDIEQTNIIDDGVHIDIDKKSGITELGFHSPYLTKEDIPKFEEIITNLLKNVINNTKYSYDMSKSKKLNNKSLEMGKKEKCFSVLLYIDSNGNIIKRWYGITLISVRGNLFYPRSLKLSDYDSLCNLPFNLNLFKHIESFTSEIMTSKLESLKKCIELINKNILNPPPIDKIHNFVKCIGYILSNTVGVDLFQIYNDLAIVNIDVSRSICYSTIRSPLRKFRDVLVQSQFIAIMNDYNEQQMIEFVTGKKEISKNEFQKLILHICSI